MNHIFYLSDYNWERGVLLKVNKKTYKILVNNSFTKNFSKEKCAFPNEKVCIVWETHKGVNGRGRYRVERELYPDKRINADQISRQHVSISSNSGRITE